ncbi:ribosomal-protein-serine acetyltransferase [Alkalibacillus filiformis]|uniref:Ribosomal-protein-serine acetyltransferase n=1 Tax=Alkalibacillus filiformis TaxID=200990 RepID=A0ABU0DW83_9BACI|nr:GNAT family protein [Alkalibacillus filiformis]MDQ0352728.1 ribosomal-protein-serine acetyltransferase [Alkalibacillus filiformis]
MFTYDIDDNLYLRLIDEGDCNAIYQLTNEGRDYLREWLNWVDNIQNQEDTMGFIEMAKKSFTENSGLHAVIVFRNEVVGIAGFNKLDQSNHIAKIGYWLGEGYQGNGIITKVSKALTDYAFNYLNMNKVEIRAASENVKSRAIPERLGYTEEGTIRAAENIYGVYVDHVVYGVLKKEW